MPWKETQVFEERLKFVTAYLEGSWSISELCHAYGVRHLQLRHSVQALPLAAPSNR